MQIALLMLIAVLLAGCVGHTNDGSTPSSSLAPTTPYSTSEQWLAAVCASNYYDRSGGLPNAIGTATCQSPRRTTILMGQYDSGFKAQSDAALFVRTGSSSASIVTASGGTQIFVAVNDRTGATLTPLVQYGFTITTP